MRQKLLKRINLPLISILVLSVILRLLYINQSFWLDEAAQMIESLRPFLRQADIVADFHPPLFHLLLHFWLYFGKSEVWARLLSVIFALLSITILFFFSKKMFGQKTALLASLFLAVSPYHIWYSQEVRPYMLFVFTSVLSTYFLVSKKWLYYIFASFLCLYSLYFAPFLLFGHLVYICFFSKKHLKNFFISLLATLSTFLVWLPLFLAQLKVGTKGAFQGWTNVVSVAPLKSIPLTFAKFIFGRGSVDNNIIYFIIILPVFLIFLLSLWKLKKTKKDQSLLVLFIVPFAVSVILSFFIPVIAPQRLIFLLPIFSLVLARGINCFKGNIKNLFISVVLITSIFGLFYYYLNPYVKRENWKEAVGFVEQKKDDKAISLFVFPEPFAPYQFYSQKRVDAVGVSPSFNIREKDLLELKNTIGKKDTIYFFSYLTDLTDPQNKVYDFIDLSGFKLETTKDFPGVGFIHIFRKSKVY